MTTKWRLVAETGTLEAQTLHKLNTKAALLEQPGVFSAFARLYFIDGNGVVSEPNLETIEKTWEQEQ